MKKLLICCTCIALVATLMAACGGSSVSTGGSSGPGNTVHMSNTNFVQSSITIKKGESIRLLNEVSVAHIISNGSWVNGTPKPMAEPGAPTVSNMQFNTAGQSQQIGPFNTTGTYHLYCIVHQGMNLTVIVQ